MRINDSSIPAAPPPYRPVSFGSSYAPAARPGGAEEVAKWTTS
jgi:hypothetical protein